MMGSSQSSPTDIARGEKVLERLNALQFNEKIRQQDEDEYVQVDATQSRYKGSETISIATAEAWEKELLSDPKVCISGITRVSTDKSRTDSPSLPSFQTRSTP